MVFSYNTQDPLIKNRMHRWRLESLGWFMVTVIVALATPLSSQYLLGLFFQGQTDSWFLKVSIDNWFWWYASAALMLVMGFEVYAHSIEQNEERADPPTYAVTMLRDLAQEAGIPTPTLYYFPQCKPNAGATRSFSLGRKVIWRGDIALFSPEQVRVVLAHELAHLLMRDVRTGMIKNFFVNGLKMVFLVNLTVAVVSLLLSCVQTYASWLSVPLWVVVMVIFRGQWLVVTCAVLALVGLLLPDAPWDFTFMMWVNLVVSFVGLLCVNLSAMAYLRVCEFRADAIGVDLAKRITGQDHRGALGTAIAHIRDLARKEGATLRPSSGLGHLLRSHPTLRERLHSVWLKHFVPGFWVQERRALLT